MRGHIFSCDAIGCREISVGPGAVLQSGSPGESSVAQDRDRVASKSPEYIDFRGKGR